MENNGQLIINGIKKNKIIAIIRGVKTKDLQNLMTALYNGGINFAEITFGKKSDEEGYGDLKFAIECFGDKMFIGAGTVTSENRMKLAQKAGCKYLISPVLNEQLIDFCKQNGLISIIGALSPSEIKCAYDKGASFVKVFPSNLFGAKYFKEIKAPLGEIPLIAFGGVNAQNAKEFIDSGAVAVGIGSAIVNHELINAGDFEAITNLCKNIISKIK